jgi:hypothetical protein
MPDAGHTGEERRRRELAAKESETTSWMMQWSDQDRRLERITCSGKDTKVSIEARG